MSFEDATRELESAIDAENAPTTLEQSQAPTTPEGSEDVQPHHAATQPRDTTGKFTLPEEIAPAATQVEDTPDLFAGEQVNPDELIAQNPELAPFVKQLEGAFTRKTQELAEQRKQLEGIDPTQAREALALYNQLQDPEYLVEFHGELSRQLQAAGLTRAQADAAAAEHATELARPTPSSTQPTGDALAALREYPELSGVADLLEQLEAKSSTALDRVASWEQQAEQRQQQDAIRSHQMAMAAEIQRQEMAIIQANKDNPNFTVETTPEMQASGQVSDLDAIYALSGHTDGDLFEAAKLYESVISSAAARYFGGKASASDLPGGGTSAAASQTSEVLRPPADLEEAHRAASEYLRGAGIDTVG